MEACICDVLESLALPGDWTAVTSQASIYLTHQINGLKSIYGDELHHVCEDWELFASWICQSPAHAKQGTQGGCSWAPLVWFLC